MIAVAVAFGVFACWGVVGFALTSCLLARRQGLSNLLLAPVVGMGTLELVAHAGLRCGSPVGPLALPIILGALLLSSITLLIRRPPVPIRRILPFGLILLIAFPLTAWPLVAWGCDWVANANGDWGNYCLAGTGYRDHGYFEPPGEDYLSGRDLTHGVWFLYSDVGHRHGCETSLAMTSAVTSMTVPKIFMPVIVAMHLALICATGYLTCRLAGGRTVALVTCTLMACSPLSTLGVVQQLIAQVGGMAILTAATGFFCRPARKLPTMAWVRRGVLGGILGASLLLHYTEIVPFIVAAFGLHVAIGFARGRRDFKQIAIAALSAMFIVPLLGGFLIENLEFLRGQTSHGRHSSPHLQRIFYQYLNSEGLARLWGFVTLDEQIVLRPTSSWPVHRLVIVGGLFLLLSLTACIALSRRQRPVGVQLLVMVGVTVYLFRSTYAFALFKLAMYAQPFIIGTVVLGWYRMNPGRLKIAALLCLLSLIPLQLATQYKYVSFSGGSLNAGNSLRGVTRGHLLTQFETVLRTPGAKRFVVPVTDIVMAKVVACCSRDRILCFPFGEGCVIVQPPQLDGPYRAPSGRPVASEALKRIFSRHQHAGEIALMDPADPAATARLLSYAPAWVDRPEPGDYVLDLPNRLTAFNRFHRSPDRAQTCLAIPLKDATNYLLWRRSTRSGPFDPGDKKVSGLGELQVDPLFPQDTLAASGRRLTFQVLNPTREVRVMLTGTTTFIPGDRPLPTSEVAGTRRVRFPMTGVGAARVVSEPVTLQTIGTSTYLALDLGSPTLPDGDTDTDAAAQFFRAISLYVRDVSLLTEDECRAIVPPECVKAFPADLANRQLEFSGCAESGWVSLRSWFRLTRPAGPATLVVRGILPPLDSDSQYQNEVVVKWNGVEVGRKTIKLGEFELRVSAPPDVGAGRLDLEFANVRQLVPPATRTGSAQLKFVGYER